MTITALAS